MAGCKTPRLFEGQSLDGVPVHELMARGKVEVRPTFYPTGCMVEYRIECDLTAIKAEIAIDNAWENNTDDFQDHG